MQWNEVEYECPDELMGIPLEMGIDEAGRGPVLGPMLYCGAVAPLGYEWPSRVNDSKQVSVEERISILDELKKLPVGFIIRSISAAEISAACLSHSSASLNTLSFETARDIVKKALDKGLDIKKLYVDTVGNEEKYQSWLKKQFPLIDITVKSKADAQFKCVGAASIQAKIRRDYELENFQFEEPNIEADKNFGCGYPNDALTKEWLENNFDRVFGFPSIVRFSWANAKQICENKSPAYFESPEGKRIIDSSSFFIVRNLRTASFE